MIRIFLPRFWFVFLGFSLVLPTAVLAAVGWSDTRNAFQDEVLHQIPELKWIDANPQATSGVSGDNLQVWGLNTMRSFAVEGDQVYAFAGQAGTPSGIPAGRFLVEGFRVRIYNTASGFDRTLSISFAGEWNQEPAGGFYYNQPVVPSSARQAIDALRPDDRQIIMEVVDYGRISLESFPVAQVQQFARTKVAARQREEGLARQQELAEQQAAQTRTPEGQTSGSTTETYGADNGPDQEQWQQMARERQQRRAIRRQADATWDAYQQSLRDIENAFRRDPEVVRQLEEERAQAEREYEEKQRRKAEEAEQDRLEQEAYEREQDEKRRLREIENRKRSAEYAAYEQRRSQDRQAWVASGGPGRVQQAVEVWKDNVADYLIGLDMANKTMNFTRESAETQYASPEGLLRLVERVLIQPDMPPYLKRLYIKNIAGWRNSWITIHVENNFYPSRPAQPDNRAGEVPGLEYLTELAPYFNALNGNDILVDTWGAKPVYAKTQRLIKVGDEDIRAGTEFYKAALDFSDGLKSSDRVADYPRHGKYLYGLVLTPEHVAYLEDLVNLRKDQVNVSQGVAYGHITTLNMLIAHDLFSGDAARAYFRMQQAFALLGIESVQDLFDRPLYWSGYASYMQVFDGEDRLLKNERTKRLVYNAAYVYKANGYFKESEAILTALMKQFRAPGRPAYRKWFHSDFNYFDLMVNLMDLYAHQERWQDLLALSNRFEADFASATAALKGYNNLLADPTIASYQPGLFASRPLLSMLKWETIAYRAQAEVGMGDRKSALRSLKPVLKALKKNPEGLTRDPYLNRILDPLLLNLSLKDHKKYYAGKSHVSAPALSSVSRPVGGVASGQASAAWAKQYAALLAEYQRAYDDHKDPLGAADIAIELLPTVADGALLATADAQSFRKMLFDTSYTYFLAGKYVEGVTVAKLYGRLFPTDANKAEGLAMLNALMGNIYWVRLHQYGPWLEQGEVNGHGIGTGKEDPKQIYFLQSGLTQFGRDTFDGSKGRELLEQALTDLADQAFWSQPVMYLVNAANASR
ncbi:hypothetical protein [Kordiimonas sp.]|uniref:hypothetical protein n=1 Tax=Kordiimonas sp. TaxID=1970157 RepID=UPI003A8CE4FB